ncbi:MAG TPA: hypothetical protein VJ226_11540 [Bradyrhizobium sp.]|nr:hypothetical protein [Bradyrhizobium sp.]
MTEFTNLEITGADKRCRTCMAKGLPKVLRSLYRSGGAWAAYGFAGDEAVIFAIKRHNHELDDFGHSPLPSISATQRYFLFFVLS